MWMDRLFHFPSFRFFLKILISLTSFCVYPKKKSTLLHVHVLLCACTTLSGNEDLFRFQFHLPQSVFLFRFHLLTFNFDFVSLYHYVRFCFPVSLISISILFSSFNFVSSYPNSLLILPMSSSNANRASQSECDSCDSYMLCG